MSLTRPENCYNLEATRVSKQRLISLILLICLSYTLANFNGQYIQQKWLASYVNRPSYHSIFYRRHSSFYIGLHGKNWLDSMSFVSELIQ
ncbi:hypothetical protein BI334_20400 [Moorena producens 3L]|nr:hypothetical protein BI334_20400 [Moorena producens 3L]